MKVIKHFAKQWFNEELNQYDGWKEYQEFIACYLRDKSREQRFALYHKHLALIQSKWGIQYGRTTECAFVRELIASNKNKKFFAELEATLSAKYSKAA